MAIGHRVEGSLASAEQSELPERSAVRASPPAGADVVHITADFPDVYAPDKTRAVKSLIELTPQFRHWVYSINRKSGLSGVALRGVEQGVTTLTYRALPLGLLMGMGLSPLREWILQDLKRRDVRPACLHAHKLTVEGLVALPLSRALGRPFICNVWGDTDQKMIHRKPELRAAFREVADAACRILPATPWAADYVARTLGVPAEKMTILPVPSRVGPRLLSPHSKAGLVTMLRLDSHRRKNIAGLIAAVARLRDGGKTVRLDIYGSGSPAAQRAVNGLIERAGLLDQVRLTGPVDHSEVQSTLARYSGFALPSLRETFGMVFVEALFSGLPILYPREQAIDGFFADAGVGYRCDPRDVADIARGLEYLLQHEADLKAAIALHHEKGLFRQFEDGPIAEGYAHIVAGASRDATFPAEEDPSVG